MHALKVQSWSEDQAQQILAARLRESREYREANFEKQWLANEMAVFNTGNMSDRPTLSYNSMAEVFQANAESMPTVRIPRVAQNLRFLHSQMSANPPSVIPQPTSNELKDRRATEAADDFIVYGRKQYKLQEYTDLTCLSTLVYGTGVVKAYHDPHAGTTLKFEENSNDITMTGDFKCRPTLIWDVWFDKDAKVWEDVRYVQERHLMPMEMALSIWPEHEEELKACMVDAESHPSKINSLKKRKDTIMSDEDFGNVLVEIFEYTEKALPTNGMAGRRCFHTADGVILGKMEPNPHPEARLPYGILTDIDVPGEVYGKTTVDYALGLAQVVDALDNMVLNNVDLHGSIKLVVFDSSEINPDDLSNQPVDIITVNGTHAQAPYQLKPASVSSDVYSLRAQLMEGIDGIMGVNEILKGQINRELSGFASQTAINAANMVRHRVFNKYQDLVEFVYETYLMNVRDNWKVARKIKILGPEDMPTIKYYQGSDISGGYALKVEYGANFSLDPAMRREEIMQAKDLLVEAGVNPKTIAQKLRYNEIDGLFDAVEMAKKRQIEIFERAITNYEKTGIADVEPASVMRKAFHMEMAEAAMEFVMTRDFLNLDAELREAIYAHIDEREQLAAEQMAPPPAEGMPGQPPIGAPGMPPMGMPPLPDIGGVL